MRSRTSRYLRLALFGIVTALTLAACASTPTAPKHQAGQPYTMDQSQYYSGPVTPEVFFRYLNWTGPMSLGTMSQSSDRVSSSSTHSSSGWIFVAIAGGGHSQSDSHATTQTVNYFQLNVINSVGQTLLLKWPQSMFVFYQLAGVNPHVEFRYKNITFYNKSTMGQTDTNSIFDPEEGMNIGPLDHPGDTFSNTPVATLLQRYTAQVFVYLTPEQYQQLTDPQVQGVPAPSR